MIYLLMWKGRNLYLKQQKYNGGKLTMNEELEIKEPTENPLTEEKPARTFKVVKRKNVTRLKNSGIADDFVEASVEGKAIPKNKRKALYHEDDSLEDMEQATADLIADSSRKILRKMEEDENAHLEELVARTYAPRQKERVINEKKMVRNIINMV